MSSITKGRLSKEEEDMYQLNKETYYKERDRYSDGMWVLYQNGQLVTCDDDKDAVLSLISRGCFLIRCGSENHIGLIPSFQHVSPSS